MQPFRRCCLIVLTYTILVLIQQVAWAQADRSVEELREEQMQLGCQLKYNSTLRAEFFNSIGNPDKITKISRVAEGYTDNVRCWAVRYPGCSGASTSWCIHLYHPEKKIELCYDSAGHVTERTDAAAALQLEEKFEISPEKLMAMRKNEKLCHRRWPGCLRSIAPETFQAHSYLSCTAQSDTCNKTTYNIFEVAGSGDDLIKPTVDFTNSEDVFLNETNIFQCNISVPAKTYLRGFRTGWKINNQALEREIPQHPNCDLNPSLYVEGTDNEECQTTFEDTAMLKQQRIRPYKMQYTLQTCPFQTVLVLAWLVIEETSLEDLKVKYECFGEYLVSNPHISLLVENKTLGLNPVYPLVEVITMDRPQIVSDTYLPEPYETQQWNCSVQAGLGDTLVWRLDGENISHIDVDNPNSTEDINCSSLLATYSVGSVAFTETKELGQYERQLTSTLHVCQFTVGLYECVLLRSRGDERTVRVWSTTVVSSVSPPEGPKHLVIIISVSVVTSFILVVFLLVAIITLCVRQQRGKSGRAVWELAMGNISVTDDILTEFRRKNSLQKDVLGGLPLKDQEDPMEFPRNKLILLDKILGEGTFGLVRQAKAEGIVESTPERNIVAVKTTRAKAPPEEINNFWEELQLMKNMVPHGNIINLLGHCTTPGGPVYMIIEYANHGSLKDFLKSCEEAVLKLNHIPQVQQSFRSCRTSSTNSGSSTYPHLVFKLPLSAQNSVFSSASTPTALIPSASSSGFDFSSADHEQSSREERLVTQDSGFFGENVDLAAFNEASGGALAAHTVAPLTHNYVNSKGLLYMEDVQNFALQIACGLKHLEEIQVVHCDLAARNILIAEGFMLKIGDFGMARDVSEKEYYRKQGGRVPVKWTAPEALMDHTFTFKSDIWSYGVVLWEIVTYGQQPYSKFKIRHSWDPFINYLMEGNRLQQPKGCPDPIYTLMQNCWHSSPHQRPTAEDLVQLLSQTNLLCNEGETDGMSGSDSGTQLSIGLPTAMPTAPGAYPQETEV